MKRGLSSVLTLIEMLILSATPVLSSFVQCMPSNIEQAMSSNDIGLQRSVVNNESRIISELGDSDGDTSVGYLDVTEASILQVNSELVQFNMKLKENIPLTYSLDTYVAFIWFLDVDQDPTTGQGHTFVASEYNVRVAFSEGEWGGYIDVTVPGMEGGGNANVFIEANSVSILLNKAQIGENYSFAWEICAFAYGEVEGGDSADECSAASLYLEDPSPGHIYEVRVIPTFLTYAKGELSKKLQILALDVEKNRLETENSNVSFFIPETLIASYSNSRTLNIKAIGLASIIARVGGIISVNKATLMCGKVKLVPPVLLLSIEGNNTGQLYLDIERPDGTHPSMNDLDVEFHSSNPEVASVDSNGLVTAVTPPAFFWDTPYISVCINAFWVENAAVVRVTQDNLDVQLTSYGGNHVNFSTAESFGPYNWGKLMEDFEAVKVSDIVYEVSSQLTGVIPWGGNTQFLVLDPGYDSDGTVPCGLSGNPIRLGLGVDNNRSCFGLKENLQWGIWYHEMGHNFGTPMRGELCRMNGIYEETIASTMGIYSVDFLIQRSELYGLSSETISALDDSNVPLLPAFGRRVYLEALRNYVENGCNYSEINPDILEGILLSLQDEHGLDMYNFFSTISPETSIWVNINTEEKQATFFAAALSTSTGEDLRSKFRDDWGFPISDTFYDSIWDKLRLQIDSRNPHALAGEDILAHVGKIVQLNGNNSYDLMGSELSYDWALVSKPLGSNATLSDSTVSNPTILVDSIGEYILNLSVSNMLKSSNSDSVKIQVSAPTLGDLNNDGIVDIFDVVLAALAFGSIPDDLNWNQAADLNNDDVVDIFDIVLLANNFGKTT